MATKSRTPRSNFDRAAERECRPSPRKAAAHHRHCYNVRERGLFLFLLLNMRATPTLTMREKKMVIFALRETRKLIISTFNCRFLVGGGAFSLSIYLSIYLSIFLFL